jgi:uncharacterized membrane protein
MMWKQYLIEIFSKNEGKFIGAISGLLVGILILWIGFFKSVFIVICILLGYYIGKKKDNKENIFVIIEKLINRGWK